MVRLFPEWIPHEMDHPPAEDSTGPEGAISLEELAASLEDDDGDELALAVEGLSSVEPEIRAGIIDGLGKLPRGPGLSAFLLALSESADPATSLAARGALHFEPEVPRPVAEWLPVLRPAEDHALARHRLARSLVSVVDGEGRATIAISATREGTRRSAVFHCDVLKGVSHAFGRIEDESPEAGGLIDEAISAGSDHLLDVPELALSLLAGTLLIGPRERATHPARSWVDEVLGSDFRPRPIPIPVLSVEQESSTSLDEMPRHAEAVLERCPSWVDTSALTFELAQEIELREGEARRTDPLRHAGAYRYLFEHHLIRRLDLYGRMLLWMAWFWRFAGEPGLANSAVAVALELADEQYAVPSHPFTVALTTRSLDEARLLARARRRSDVLASFPSAQ